MGRRDGDERPPVELWGADPSPPEVQRLEVGGGRSLRRPLLVVAAIGAVVLAGLALGGDDESSDRSSAAPTSTAPRRAPSTTRPPSPSTTTTVALRSGPVFGRPVGGGIVVHTGEARWTWIDLDTGAQRDLRFQPSTEGSAVAVRGGVVIVQDGAEFVPLPDGDHVPLGPAGMVLPSGDPEAVWLIRNLNIGDPGDPGARAQLVDLQGTPKGPELSIPGGYPAGAGRSSVLMVAAGRVYRADADGVHPLVVGELLAVNGDRAVVNACDDQLQCALWKVDVPTGRTTPLAPTPAVGFTVLVSDSGGVAIQSHESDVSLLVYDADGTTFGEIDLGARDLGPAALAWMPGDLGLLVQRPDGLTRVGWTAGGLAEEPIPALASVSGGQVLVIPG